MKASKVERMAVTDDAKMEQARAVGRLCDWLQENGFRVETNHQASIENECKWYAWRQLDGARDCDLNEKPPSLIVHPHLLTMRDRQYAGVELSVTGQHAGPWFTLKAYSIGVDELAAHLSQVEGALRRAWAALEGGQR
jgi:hypothetical protein